MRKVGLNLISGIWYVGLNYTEASDRRCHLNRGHVILHQLVGLRS